MGKTKAEYDFLRGDWVLEEMLKVAMDDEKADREKYRRLARMAEKERDRKTLFSIADDEGNHLKLLQMMFRKLYGKNAPKSHGANPRPGGFKEMIGKSIVSEHEGVLFYQDVLGHLSCEELKTVIRQIMADEQRHGQLLEGIFERR